MGDWLVSQEAAVRLTVFLAFFAVIVVLQRLSPRRDVPGGWRRSATNIALVVVGTLVLRLGFPLLAFDLALRQEANGAGLLNAWPAWLGVTAGILVLDLAIYWQHRILHKVPLLWRMHRVHHADTGFDVTTGLRFHPFEIAFSMLIKLGLIALFGIPALAVVVFEILLNAGSLFTHANVSLTGPPERRLRWFVVTPEMHRIHHSVHRDETDSNFGFHLSLWDRVFRSYKAEPRDGHRAMSIGLADYRSDTEQTLPALLVNPFRR